MNNQNTLMEFWKKYCEKAGIDYLNQSYDDAWSFGDNAEMANELAQLVIEGKKTTTTASLLELEHYKWKIGEPGEKVIILGGDGEPKAIIEYLEIETMRYDNMEDVHFAIDEGEGFDTLEIWRDVHWRYFSRTLEKFGEKATEDMKIICYRFRCLYP